MRWLCIEAHLLGGRYHGRSDEGRRPQWPPNPHRLFQALVAAANLGFRRTEFSDSKKEAFRWLERCDPPEIVAPPFQAGRAIRLYVPNNDMDKVAAAWARGTEPEKQPAELRTNKDLRPHLINGDRVVRFLWSIPDGVWQTVQAHARVLCEEARHLHSLGLGIDLVAGNGRILSEAERYGLPGEVFIADAEAIGWRVPAEGSFDELVARYTQQTDRVRASSGSGALRWVASPGPPTIFREVAYVPRAKPRGRRVHAFALVNEDGAYRSFDARDAIKVAAWMRHAAHKIAQRLKFDPEFVERFVCGHGEDANAKNDRFSYLPLPTISVQGRDGRIRRVLVAEPAGGADAKALAIVRRLGGFGLVAERTGEVMADLRVIGQPPADGVTVRYLRPSRRWGTVTPIVLPGRDDRRSRKTHGLVLRALMQAGYTTPVTEIHLQSEPVFPGAEMARSYRVPTYLKPYPRMHAVITFAEPVVGPISIGSGRHLGLGVLASFT